MELITVNVVVQETESSGDSNYDKVLEEIQGKEKEEEFRPFTFNKEDFSYVVEGNPHTALGLVNGLTVYVKESQEEVVKLLC